MKSTVCPKTAACKTAHPDRDGPVRTVTSSLPSWAAAAQVLRAQAAQVQLSSMVHWSSEARWQLQRGSESLGIGDCASLGQGFAEWPVAQLGKKNAPASVAWLRPRFMLQLTFPANRYALPCPGACRRYYCLSVTWPVDRPPSCRSLPGAHIGPSEPLRCAGRTRAWFCFRQRLTTGAHRPNRTPPGLQGSVHPAQHHRAP